MNLFKVKVEFSNEAQRMLGGTDIKEQYVNLDYVDSVYAKEVLVSPGRYTDSMETIIEAVYTIRYFLTTVSNRTYQLTKESYDDVLKELTNNKSLNKPLYD